MSELYELHLARLERDGFLDEDRWGPQTKSGKRTGDGGQPPPANGGANTSGGKGTSARFAAGKGKGKGKGGKSKPVPPWMRGNTQPGKTARGVPPGSSEDRRRGGRGGNARKDAKAWGTEAGMAEHESYRHPFAGSRDNGLSARLRNRPGPQSHPTNPSGTRGNGYSDVSGGEPRLNAQRGDRYVGNYSKPGTGGAAGNPYASGRSGNGYSGGNSSGGGSTPKPGNLKKRKRSGGSGGRSGPNQFESGHSPTGFDRAPKPPNVRKSVYDYSPEQVQDSIDVITKALGGILDEYQD